MKRFRSNSLAQILALIAAVLIAVPLNTFAQGPATQIKPLPLEYFVSEHRIKVSADVADEAGIKLVRCYFRAAGQADYVFVQMDPAKGNTYEGILPKPDTDTQTLEYIFLAVNQKDQVVKTEIFKVEKGEGKEVPEWQKVTSEGEIRVSTELAKAPETLPGFKDSITLDAVESAGRFGTAVGIYLLIDTGSGGSAAPAAEEKIQRFQEANKASVGKESASGLSTKAIVAIAAGVVAGGGAIVALADNGGDEDSDDLAIELSDSPPFYCGGSIRFSASGGKEPYKFLANNEVFAEGGNTAVFETETLFNATGKCPDKVEIRVTDGNGDNASKFVEIQPNVNITLPQ